jgi:iron complex outermembrane recepter protein
MRRAVITSRVSLITIALTLSVPAFAQGQPGLPVQPTEQADQDESIVVTGTRLQRDPNTTAASPISTVPAADIRSSGQTDVAEVLREYPALIGSGTTGDSIEGGAGGLTPSGVGQATLDLRGLGDNRTLVLVNGRRHVSGVAGSTIVDIATIPRALIQSVDILTGGASSIYGADAVSGVVNFNLRENYEGIELSAQVGISERGDGRTFSADAIWGRNFFEGRANLVIAGSYTNNDNLLFGQRDFARNNTQGTATITYQHPDRRFQTGDISAAATPNFFNFFNTAAGRYPIGFAVPLPGTAAYNAIYGGGGAPTAAEQALITRASGSPTLILARDPRFGISSNSGLIARADFGGFNADINGNGISDCDESFIGFRYANITGVGGCYVNTPGGGVQIFQDGRIATNSNQIGGSGVPESSNFVDMLPQIERYDVNLLFNFEFSPAFRLFTELKYVRSEAASWVGNVNSFYDQLYVFPDNVFIPAVLRPDAVDAGGLRVSRDFGEIPNSFDSRRDTYRAVVGFRGEITPHLNYLVYGNYGRTEDDTYTTNVLPDRFFAAIDVVQGPGGPVCASNLTPARLQPGSEFFPVIGPGAFTFTPGPSSGCQPINLFASDNAAVSPAALAWITDQGLTRSVQDQLVFSAELTGDTGGFFNLWGGPIQFAVGAEYRRERSRTTFDNFTLGILPTGSPAGPAGGFVGDFDPNAYDADFDGIPDPRQSLIFDGSTRTLNTSGSYNVAEIFGEVRLPILRDRPFFHQLTLEGAARYSDYSTVGGTFTWNVNAIWAPIRDIRFRGTYAVAIRAPNIAELFSPAQGTVFRPVDPCDVNVIAALPDAAQAARRQANCAAEGAPAGYTDPLTARFSGTAGGNPDLQEETATTWTVGVVLQPRWIPGLSISADYYNVEIEDAIAAVAAQDVVNNCYDSATFPNQYCDLFDRRADFGLSFLRQTQLNFGRLTTAGIDATISYAFSVGAHRFNLRASGNWTDYVDAYFDPANPEIFNPALGEVRVPEWSAVGSASWSNGPYSVTYRLQYLSSQTYAGVQIERADSEFGPAAYAPEYFIHDLSFSIDAGDRFTFYGGINNFTNEQPYFNRVSYPVSPVGRFFFVGARARF